MKVVPTWHPSFIQRGNWKHLHTIKGDVERAVLESSSPSLTRQPVRYCTSPTPVEAKEVLKPGDDRPMTLDIETIRETGEIVCCGVGREVGHVVCLPWREPYKLLLRRALKDNASSKIAHNIGFDFPRLAVGLGLELHEIGGRWFDTLESHAICYSDLPHNLEFVSSQAGYDRYPWKYLHKQGEVTIEWYNCHDVDATMWAFLYLQDKMSEFGLNGLFDETVMPALPIMIHMHETGVRVDMDRMTEVGSYFKEREQVAQELINDFVLALPGRRVLADRLERSIDALEATYERLYVPGTKRKAIRCRAHAKKLREKLEKLRGVSPLAPAQLAKVLFEDFGIVDKYNGSTDEESIVAMLALTKGTGSSKIDPRFAPFLKAVLDFREAHGMVAKYLSYPSEHLHPRFLLWGTGTGRLSCRDPNIQNIPVREEWAWKIRQTLLPPVPGWVFNEADYSQLERRIQAIIWQDEALLNSYANDEDTHTMTAAMMYGCQPEEVTRELRYNAKRGVYLQSYGGGPDKLRRTFATEGIYISFAEAKAILASIETAHPGVARGQQEAVSRSAQDNHLRNRFGRIRWFLKPGGGWGDAMNYHPQSNAADIILKAMIAAREEIKGDWVMPAQIHDSILTATPPGAAEEITKKVQEIMERPVPELDGNSFPTDAKTGGKNWAFRED